MTLRSAAMRGLMAVLVFCTLPAWAGFQRVNQPNPADPMAVRIYRLDNGLMVYLTENHDTERFYAEIAVRAGSKHDPAESTGLAHYLEHLLFKGTERLGALDYEKEKPYLDKISDLYEQHFREVDPEKRGEIYSQINALSLEASSWAVPNEMDNLYNAMGATHVNAFTSDESTVYQSGLPANRLDQWAVLESERFSNPVFRLFHTELETVYEEKNRSLDNADWITSEELARTLFPIHPYGQQPTIGLVEHLKNPSLVNIHKYFDTYYVPNNMAICISGAVDVEAVIALIDQHFSALSPEPLPEPKTWSDPGPKGETRTTVKFPGEPEVQIGWRTAPKGHADEEALTVADFIMDNQVAGLININLNQKQAVRQAAGFHQFMNEAGLEVLSGVPKDGQTLDEVEGLLLEQMELLKSGAFEDWLIPAIVNDFKKTQKAQLENDMSRVALMRQSFISFEEWDDSVARIERIERVTKEDVVRVANAYFGGDRVVLWRVDEQNDLPQIDKPKIDPLTIDPTRQSEFAKMIEAMEVKPNEPVFVKAGRDFEVREIAPGTNLYYTPNPLNDLFSLTVLIDKGTLHDNRLPIAAQLLDKAGAGAFTAEELRKEWYKLGTDFTIAAGDQLTSVSLSGLDENLSASLDLMQTVLGDPKVEQDVLDSLVAITLVQREDGMKDPATIGRALFSFNRYGAESPFLQVLPAESLKALSVGELTELIKDLAHYKHSIIYAGALPIDRVIETLTAHRPAQAELSDPPAHIFRHARTPAQSEIYLFDKDSAQSQVRFEFVDGVFNEKERTVTDLYNEYFGGGMSGVVFQELREARALAYSAGALYLTGEQLDEENLMLGVIGCQADKTPEAVEAFVELFDNLPESPERFAGAKDGLLNQYRASKIPFRGLGAIVRAWEKQGVEPDPRKARYKATKNAELADLLAFVDGRIEGRPKLISIVGPKDKIDLARLEKAAPIRELTLEEIFVK